MDISGVNAITLASGLTNIVIASNAVVYTKAMYIGLSKFHSLSYIASSVAGGIELKIEVEQSFRLPTTEGAADTYWAEPESMSDIVAALTTENQIYHKSLSLIPLPYFRLKITGGAANSADTILNAWLTKQEST